MSALRSYSPPLDPILRGPQLGSLAVIAKARVAQLTGCPSIAAAAELAVTFGDCFDRWKARLLSCLGSSAAQGIGGRVRTPAPTEYPETRLSLRRGRSQTGPGVPAGGPVCRPYGLSRFVAETSVISEPTLIRLASARRLPPLEGEGLRAADSRPYGEKRTGSVGSANLRRRSGNRTGTSNFAHPGPQWAGGIQTHPSTPGFARRKCSAHFKG